MNDRISPPSWTEWTRNPNDRTPQRKVFDEILGELRKEGLIEVRGSLFVHLARYSYLHVKNAVVEVKAFLQSVPDSIFGPVAPNFRLAEVEAVLKILATAGLVSVVEESGSSPVKVLLTERQAPGEVARGQVVHTILAHLRDVLGKMDPVTLVSRPGSFPTIEAVVKATGVDREILVPSEDCVAVQDRPDSNETNPNPFLQETVDAGSASLSLLQFWALPDPKAEGGPASDPEFTIVMPREVSLESLVRNYCVPVLEEFFRDPGHRDEAAGIQARYASYMHKYREKFTASGGLPASDRIDKVISSSDVDGEAFANAVYVVVQVLRKSPGSVVYQSARIAWARAMALRVHKRKAEKESASRSQDSALLVTRLRQSPRPITLEELKHTLDVTKKKEIGSKYATLAELLPLDPPKEGQRPVLYEVKGAFVHRENLVRTFLDLREHESIAQQERLALQWAHEGIPPVESLYLGDKDVSPPFLRVFELIHQERLMSTTLSDFVKDFLPADLDMGDIAHWLWPDGRKGAPTPSEIVNRGLDVILYEDRDRLKKRSLVGVLSLTGAYPDIVKATWNVIFMEEGVFRFLLRRMMSLFGQRPKPASKPAKESKGGSSSSSGKKSAKGSGSGGGGGGGGGSSGGVDAKALRAAELKKLKELAPLAGDKETLVRERDKSFSQWCFKLDGDAARKTRDAVDNEVARHSLKIAIEQLTEENSAKVALFLVEKSQILEGVTSSRAFHRYLYLTALQKRTETLSR